MERMDALQRLTQYISMNTTLAKRAEAHRAALQNVGQDALVQADMDAKRQTAEVMARWNDRRRETFPHTPERRKASTERRVLIRRQAE